jgi:murein DD-endopeptidase MepM/ murein hydrolase activator NlpD
MLSPLRGIRGIAGAARLLIPLLAMTAGFSASLSADPAQPKPPASASGIPSASPASPPRTVNLTVKRGDTLLAMLRGQSMDANYSAQVLSAISGQINPRLLHIGDQVRLQVQSVASITILDEIDVQPKKGAPLVVVLPSALRQISESRHEIYGPVGHDLSASLKQSSLPSPLAGEVLIASKFDPDLKSSLTPSSTFDILYGETTLGPRRLGSPTLQQITFSTGDLKHRLYLYRDAFNNNSLVNANGKGLLWLHFRQPVLNARLSSPFGWRIHPVFGDRRFHNGIDLATTEGNAVYAAADGIVIDSGWHGNYGQYIRVRHSGGVETTYGHLSKIAADIRPGVRVTSGEVIGAVGETGVATGPHLYFEVNIGGSYVDPLKVPPAVPIKLTGTDLKDLKKQIMKVAQN